MSLRRDCMPLGAESLCLWDGRMCSGRGAYADGMAVYATWEESMFPGTNDNTERDDNTQVISSTEQA